MILLSVLSIRFLHKWLSVVIGLQILIWVLSGTLISLLDQQTVSGRVTQSASLKTELASVISSKGSLFSSSELVRSATRDVSAITLTTFNQTLSYRLETQDGPLFFDAHSGQALRLRESDVKRIALLSYRGPAMLNGIELLENGSDELGLDVPVWRIKFDDGIATRVYISDADGSVLAHRNRYWKVVDFLLMLHFMDYAREHSFNNVQILIVGFLSLWLALSGLILVKSSFNRRDFTIRGFTR